MSVFKNLSKKVEKNWKLILLVVVVVAFIYYMIQQSKSTPSSNSGKPKIMYSKTCGYSRKQLQILKDNNMTDKFELIDCAQEPERCKGLSGVPTLELKNGKRISGLQSLDKLKTYV